MARGRRGDWIERLWRSLGRPGSLKSFRLSVAASKRKSKRKRARSHSLPAKRKKTFGEGAFTRVAPPPTDFPEGLAPKWGEWSRRRRGVDVDELDRKRIHTIASRLERIVPPHVVDQMRGMEMRRWYAIEIVVDQYHADSVPDEAPPGYDVSKRRIRMVGLGRRLWFKVGNVAESGEIEDVEIRDVSGALTDEQQRKAATLRPDRQAWALWGSPSSKRQFVTLDDGARFYGRGDFLAWKAEAKARKGGRKRKRTGRLSYQEGRRASRADKAASARWRKTEAKIRALRAAGRHVEADRLERRAESQRRAQRSRVEVKGTGIFARAKPKRRSKRKGKGKRT